LPDNAFRHANFPRGDALRDGVEQRLHHPGAGQDGAFGRGVITGHRTAVEQRPPRRLVDRPLPGCAAHAEQAVAGGRDRDGACLVDGTGELGVRVDQQQGEQVVAARDIAVHGGRHHAEVASDGAQ
jgi:hypothetical protein